MWGLANDTGTHRDDVVNEDGVHLSCRGTSFYAGAMCNKFRTIVPA